MSALVHLGRVTAIAFFVALPAVWLGQPVITTPSPTPEARPPESIAAAPVNVLSGVSVEVSPPVTPDEQQGDAYYVHRQYQAAIEAFSRIEKPSASVWNRMGIAYEMLFDQKDAIRCYKECLKLDPDNPHALNNLATLADNQKDFATAERLHRKAVEVSPRSARLIMNLGTNLLLQHKYQESSDAYAQALAIDPHIFDRDHGPTTGAPATERDSGELSYIKARSCARAGLTDCAVDHLRKAFDEGFATKKQVGKESDFGTLRGVPEFERLLAERR